MPDIVYMTHEGKQNGITIGKSEAGMAAERLGPVGSITKGTANEIRGSGLNEGSQQPTVGGTPPTTAGTDQGVLPRGIDPIVKNLRSAGDVQIDAIGLTRKPSFGLGLYVFRNLSYYANFSLQNHSRLWMNSPF